MFDEGVLSIVEKEHGVVLRSSAKAGVGVLVVFVLLNVFFVLTSQQW